MAIDRRDVSLVNGAMQATVQTSFETILVDMDVTAEDVGRLHEINTPQGETTWHEARFDNSAGRIATVKWRREVVFLNGFEKVADSQYRKPMSNFRASATNATPTASETGNACKVTVSVEVVVAAGFSKTVSVTNNVVGILVEDANKAWIDATLDPIV